MMNQLNHSLRFACHGVTLLELLIAVAAITLLALGTLTALGQSRVLRQRGKHRAELALLAQSELDRLRLQPLADLAAGEREATETTHTANIMLHDRITPRADGTWELTVIAERRAPAGTHTFELVTLHPEGKRGRP